MHELSLAGAVLETVEKHAAGRPVKVVTLRVGALRQVVPESLAFMFELVARDTICEGARLDQELIAARLRCRECAHEWEIDVPDFLCPACKKGLRPLYRAGEVVAGNEFEVESIDVEEVACIA